jgi:ribosomal protein S27AE
MLDISTTLKHYKRKEVQDAILASCNDREVAVRFGDKGFGKRPDILSYPNDILEYAKQGVTSFHVSEEHWFNVLNLRPELTKRDLEALRKGWDLVLDIDCKYWEYSKLITHLLIQQLKEHNISSISVKFSGSKGFHIGVPFEAFPKSFMVKTERMETRILFPDAPKKIALYLRGRIEPLLLKELRKNKSDKDIAEMVGVKESELIKRFCKKCGAEPKESQATAYFICPSCQTKIPEAVEEAQAIPSKAMYKRCDRCKVFMERIEPTQITKCYKCGSTEFEEKFDSSIILEIDTLLISSRHMYRMPYSLHEKSGLCSIVIPIDSVLSFEKDQALPEKVNPTLKFLDTSATKEGEATPLLEQAWEAPLLEMSYGDLLMDGEKQVIAKEYEVPEEAIPVSMFPPCILKGLTGIQDGKKRFMFALLNFLECCGYSNDKIDNIVHEWNKKNLEPLREVLISSQLRYRKMQRKAKILPPNCMQAYQEINICAPDNLCGKIKNPVQYAKLRSLMSNSKTEIKSKRQALTEEQKEMRRKFREMKKEKKQQEDKSADNTQIQKDQNKSTQEDNKEV